MPYFNYTPSEIANGARGLVKAAFTPKSEMSEQRMSICRSCPFGLYETESGLCNKEKGGCGCYMPGKVKLDNEHCPKGLW
jgi:hypothetical protein